MSQNTKKPILVVLRLSATVVNALGPLMALASISRHKEPGVIFLLAAFPLLNIFCIWSQVPAFLRAVALVLNAIFFLGAVVLGVTAAHPYDFSGVLGFCFGLLFPLANGFCIWYGPNAALTGKANVPASFALDSSKEDKRSKACTMKSPFLKSLCVAVCVELISWVPLLLDKLHIAVPIGDLHWLTIMVIFTIMGSIVEHNTDLVWLLTPLIEILFLLGVIFPIIAMRDRSRKKSHPSISP